MKKGDVLSEHTRLDEKSEKSSERKFGIAVGGVFVAIGLIQIFGYHTESLVWILLAGLGFVLVLLGIVFPRALTIPNGLWHLLGISLGRITNPIMLGLIFYLCFAPLGILLRILKRDILSLKFDKTKASYWNEREHATPERQSMKLQF